MQSGHRLHLSSLSGQEIAKLYVYKLSGADIKVCLNKYVSFKPLLKGGMMRNEPTLIDRIFHRQPMYQHEVDIMPLDDYAYGPLDCSASLRDDKFVDR